MAMTSRTSYRHDYPKGLMVSMGVVVAPSSPILVNVYSAVIPMMLTPQNKEEVSCT